MDWVEVEAVLQINMGLSWAMCDTDGSTRSSASNNDTGTLLA